MDDEIIFSGEINYLEEPPPFERASEPARRTPGRFGVRQSQPSASRSVPRSSAPPADRDTIAVARLNSGNGVLLAVALVVMIMQGWLYLGVRRDLGEMRTRYDQTNSSVDQMWQGAKGLDEDRMRRLAELADSVRSAIEYAQEHVRLLETNDATLGLR